MRLIKMLGLAAFAALAAMAFVVSTASADSFCEVNVGHAKECAKPLVKGEHLKGLDPVATLLDGSGKPLEECHSTALGTIGANKGAHTGVGFELNSLAWSNCKGECKTVTSAAAGFPYAGEALALSLLVHVTKSGTTTLKGCSFLNLECTYELPEGKGLLEIEGDLLIAKKVELKRIKPCNFESFFPNPGFWDAKYLITLDETEIPVYLTALP